MKRLGLSAESVKKAFANARVNLADYKERLYQPLYDYQTFADASAIANTVKYFQVPIGQTLGSTSRTLTDTNMDLAGQLPKGQAFLVTGVSVEVLPDLTITSAAQNDFSNIVYEATRGGHLVFRVGSKEYIREGNLMKFPPKNRLYSETSGTVAGVDNNYSQSTGAQFSIVPILLESNQNFEVTLNNLLDGTTITDGVRVGVTLDGYLYRNAQ